MMGSAVADAKGIFCRRLRRAVSDTTTFKTNALPTREESSARHPGGFI
jgi:hypothetical protein